MINFLGYSLEHELHQHWALLSLFTTACPLLGQCWYPVDDELTFCRRKVKHLAQNHMANE